MAVRTRLAVMALLVLVIGVPATYLAVWIDEGRIPWSDLYLLVAIPPLVSMTLAGVSVVPSRTRPHSIQGDLLGVAVGSVSIWMLAGGLAVVALAAHL
jgi:ABC-type transport system involved in cytochrome c biogenesis permease subunit